MSAQTEADVKQIQQDVMQLQQHMFNLNTHFLAAMEAVVERIQALEGENNAIAEGDDIVVKAAPNGQAKAKKAHR